MRAAVTNPSSFRHCRPPLGIGRVWVWENCRVVGVVTRRTGASDVQVLCELRRTWATEQTGQASTDDGFEARFAEWYESANRLTWLAEVDGRAVGMIALAVFDRMPKPGMPNMSWGYISNAFVLAAYRNQGIGSLLLKEALGYADVRGFARVVLSPSERAVPFYQRAGFGPADALMVRGALSGRDKFGHGEHLAPDGLQADLRRQEAGRDPLGDTPLPDGDGV
jgi:GNAT superfamily N-acetyltransferase